MSEMVERVARAICVAEGDDPEREGPWHEWWGESPYAAAARAAIEAMREPTYDMVKAGLFPDTPKPFVSTLASQMEREWHAMIDAALADPAP